MNAAASDIFSVMSPYNPLYHFHWLAEQIRNGIHPDEITIAVLKDPLDPTMVSNYALHLQIIQGFCLGLALLVLLVGIAYLMIRVLYNGCCGQRNSKEGYTSKEYMTTRVCFYGFGLLMLGGLGLSLYANVNMAQSIAYVTDIYDNALRPLTSTQLAHMQQVQNANTHLFDTFQSQLANNFSHIWNTTLAEAVTTSMNQTNFTSDAAQLQTQIASLGAKVNEMRDVRVHILQTLFSNGSVLNDTFYGTPVQEGVLSALSALTEYYNYTQLDGVMSSFNQSMAALAPLTNLANPMSFLAEQVVNELKYSEAMMTAQSYYDLLGNSMSQLYEGLTHGIRRCATALITGQNIPEGGSQLVIFTSVVNMLAMIEKFGVPILYAVAGLMVISAVCGGVAWSTHTYSIYNYLAAFFVMGIVAAWAMNAFLLPVSIITGDTCARPDFFNLTLSQTMPFKRNYTALQVPTCASCEKEAVFVGWSDFAADAKALVTPQIGLANAMMSPRPVGSVYQPGALQVLTTLESVQQSLEAADLPKPSGSDRSWKLVMRQLRRAVDSTDAQGQAMIVALDAMGKSIINDTNVLYAGFEDLKKQLKAMVPVMQALNETLAEKTAAITNAANQAIDSMQSILNEKMANYSQVPADLHVQCFANANSNRIGGDVYQSFKSALCGPVLVGLDSSWLMQALLSLLLVPLVVLSIQAFRVISFAVIVDDVFLPPF